MRPIGYQWERLRKDDGNYFLLVQLSQTLAGVFSSGYEAETFVCQM